MLHLLVDKQGNPVAVTTSAANGDERKEVEKLISKIQGLSNKKPGDRMTVLEADKGYDAAWLRQNLLNTHIFPLIPYRKIRGRETPKMEEICQTFGLSRNRWMVERAFA